MNIPIFINFTYETWHCINSPGWYPSVRYMHIKTKTFNKLHVCRSTRNPLQMDYDSIIRYVWSIHFECITGLIQCLFYFVVSHHTFQKHKNANICRIGVTFIKDKKYCVIWWIIAVNMGSVWRDFCKIYEALKAMHDPFDSDNIIIYRWNPNRKDSNISHTKSQHLKDYRTVLRLSLPNPLKPDVKSRMKM